MAYAFLILALFLSSCATVPDDVKKEMNKYRDSSAEYVNSNFEFTYIEKSKIKDNSNMALQKNIPNLRLKIT